MRLLFLTPTAAMGGAERVLLDMLQMLRSARPSWPIGLIVGNQGPLAGDAAGLGVETVVMPFPRDFAQLGDFGLATPGAWTRFARHAIGGGVSTMRYVKQLRATVAAFQPDVMHSNGIKMHLLGALAKPAGAALLWHFHDYPSSRPVTNRVIKTLKQRCDGVIAVSESVAADLRRELGSAVPVHTIWNSVDLDRFGPDGTRLDLDALAGLPPAAPGVTRIGLVATFARWKGHTLFLETLALLRASLPFRAYIVGGPLYETHASQVSVEELHSTIDRLGLGDRVGLTGFVKDTSAALRALDVVVHTSTAPEPFGLVIAEAMASARAVIVSAAGGVAELVRPETNALVYPPGDRKALAMQIERLIGDASLRCRLGDAARQSATEKFTPASMQAQLLAVYGALRGEPKAA